MNLEPPLDPTVRMIFTFSNDSNSLDIKCIVATPWAIKSCRTGFTKTLATKSHDQGCPVTRDGEIVWNTYINLCRWLAYPILPSEHKFLPRRGEHTLCGEGA